MGLREVASTLPLGFRFYPSDQEVVCHYLYNKVTNEITSQGTLIELDLHAHEPWELPEAARYFFSLRERKYATGPRTNRATKAGYWKSTGKDREVRSPATRAVVGARKALVFYQGRAPNGVKTDWMMHEFRLRSPHSPPKEDWALCRVFQKQRWDGEQEQDNTLPTFGGSSPAVQEQPMVDAETGSPIGFAPWREETVSGSNPLLNAPMWEQCNSVLEHFPQGELGSSPLAVLGSAGVGDDSGFFFDSVFQDLGGMAAFPHPWS